MTLTDLAGIGGELGLAFNKSHTKAERARRILAAYADADLSAPGSVSPSEPPLPGGPKPEFERLIDGESLEGEADTDAPQRGGARPGAGRPEGMTDEIAAYNALSKQPHPAIKMALEGAFNAWSRRAACPEIRLTKDEAVALALPWTHAVELTGLGHRIPPWMIVVLSCIWSTATIVDAKAAVARAARQARRVPVESLN